MDEDERMACFEARLDAIEARHAAEDAAAARSAERVVEIAREIKADLANLGRQVERGARRKDR